MSETICVKLAAPKSMLATIMSLTALKNSLFSFSILDKFASPSFRLLGGKLLAIPIGLLIISLIFAIAASDFSLALALRSAISLALASLFALRSALVTSLASSSVRNSALSFPASLSFLSSRDSSNKDSFAFSSCFGLDCSTFPLPSRPSTLVGVVPSACSWVACVVVPSVCCVCPATAVLTVFANSSFNTILASKFPFDISAIISSYAIALASSPLRLNVFPSSVLTTTLLTTPFLSLLTAFNPAPCGVILVPIGIAPASEL